MKGTNEIDLSGSQPGSGDLGTRQSEGVDLLDGPDAFGLKCHDHLPMIPDSPA